MGFALAGGACAREAAGAVELAPRLGLGGQGCSPAHPLAPWHLVINKQGASGPIRLAWRSPVAAAVGHWAAAAKSLSW